MPGRDPERLRNYFNLIASRQGGAEAVQEKLKAIAPAPAAGLESMAMPARATVAQERIETVIRGATPTPPQAIGLEAIIYADLRPAVDVIGGRFTIDHPLWRHLSDEGTRQRIEAVIPNIGRIELPGNRRIPYGGTGFVVGDGLIMTNRHVAEIFASGLGNRNLAFIAGGRAGIDFLRERDQPTGPTLNVRRVVMIHPYWDMAILEVEGLAGHKPLELSLLDARDLAGHDIFVVGYPAFDPRNPADVQQDLFHGNYGIKRLQPGQLHSGMQTGSFGKMVMAATHDCSTLGGNSGSAVVDLATGKVLALHFGGVYQEQNYCVPSFALSRDQRVVDAGVRFDGAAPGTPNDWGDWWTRADASEATPASDTAPGPRDAAAPDTAPRHAPAPLASAPLASTTSGSVSVLRSGGSVTIEIPLRITIELGAPQPKAALDQPREAVAEAETERMVAPFHDPEYNGRRGYQPDFLGAVVPMPGAADPAVLASTKAGERMLHYQNFSIRMHAKRRLALVCASNVTSEGALRRPEPGQAYTRAGLSGLGKSDQEKWFLDPRLEDRFQLPDAFFTKDRGAFDKGHIVRREDVAWGETYDALRRANGDSYHVTNCSPQVAGFNRSANGVNNWGDLENVVKSQASSERLCVFAGPVLDPSDAVFVGAGDARATLRAQIPVRFWKVIVAKMDDGIAAFGFVLEQDLGDVQWEFIVPPEFQPFMTPLAKIAAMTGVSFDAGLLAADQADTPRGEEVAARTGTQRRKPAGPPNG